MEGERLDVFGVAADGGPIHIGSQHVVIVGTALVLVVEVSRFGLGALHVGVVLVDELLLENGQAIQLPMVNLVSVCNDAHELVNVTLLNIDLLGQQEDCTEHFLDVQAGTLLAAAD
jgi:hypothetical protein